MAPMEMKETRSLSPGSTRRDTERLDLGIRLTDLGIAHEHR